MKTNNFGPNLFCNSDDGTSGGGGGTTPAPVQTSTPAAESTPVDSSKEVAELLAKPGQEKLTSDEIKKVMSYDPVEMLKKKREQEKLSGKPPEAKKEAAKPGAKVPPGKTEAKVVETPVTPPAPPTPVAVDPNIKALTDSVKTLVQQNQPKPDPNAKDQVYYGGVSSPLEVPMEVLDLLDSDNPQERKKGMDGIINGVANTVLKDAMTYIHTAVIPHIMKQAQEIANTTYQAQSFEQLLTSKIPTAANPALRPVINQLGSQLIQQKQAAGQQVAFNAQFVDELMPIVASYIQSLGNNVNTGGSPGSSVVNSNPQNRQPGPHIPDPRARPPAATESFSESADLMSMITPGVRRAN